MSQEFIREVDEELQRDRLVALARRWGPLLALLVLALVGGVAGKVAWDWRQERNRQEWAAAFDVADALLRSGKLDEAAAAFAALASGSSGAAGVALLRHAQVLEAAGKQDDALAAYRRLADDARQDDLLRAAARLAVIAREIDTAEPGALMAALEPETQAGRPFRLTALELLADAQLRAGEVTKARETLDRIDQDALTPAAMRARIAELRAALGDAPS